MIKKTTNTCLFPQQWVEFLSKHYRHQGNPVLHELSQRNLFAVGWLVWFYGNSRRLHKNCTGEESKYFSYTHQELNSIFGRAQFHALNLQIGVFYVHKYFGAGGQGHTRGYELSPVVAELLRQFCIEHQFCNVDLIKISGQSLQSLPSGIVGTRKNNQRNRCWRGTQFNSLIPARNDYLDKLIDSYRCLWEELKTDRSIERQRLDQVELILHQATMFRIISNNSIAPGFFPMIYQESDSGRLYSPGTNLQNCSRIVRTAAMHGAFDVDIENCHYNLLTQQFERQSGATLGAMQDYIDTPRSIQADLCGRFGLERDQVKQVLISLVYDAPRSTSSKCSIVKTLGCKDKAAALLEDTFFNELSQETRHVVSFLSDQAKKNAKSGSIVNRAGCGLKLSEKPSRGQIIAHQLQGTEAVILKECVSFCNNDSFPPLLLQHDGFSIHTPPDTDQLSHHVEKTVGVKVKFSIKKLGHEQELKSTFPKSPNAETLIGRGLDQSLYASNGS
ncbi:MAG: hypothetical protein O9274_05660 [Limnobacter sp.]|uniref:hypothetical protein n=1 Tax=Limnobacter sp. TaxID=2003368 RepID=UPI0022CAB59C|nr:hypothetical protein [Limnobacter sp.]MCZ8015165.1 hypothetical protein [Limnobacter sp.]